MLKLTALRSLTATLAAVLLFGIPAAAQLRADFTLTKTGGCAPLVVSFTNTTTGASANATYSWDLGNGNSSVLKNAGAVYEQEKSYTVTLTVKDGAQTATKSQTVTVYKKPTVDFSASLAKGCLPLPVTFTGNATAGDGTISSWTWDFGDGTVQGAPATVSHTYIASQKASVGVTVTNSFGCSNTVQKAEVVDIRPQLTAAFNADKRVLCKVSDPVQFTNGSTGPGTLSYQWNFGDGNSSTAKDPAYAFNQRGTYTVALTVNSTEGCTATSTQTAYLNAANYSSDFSVPALVCKNSYVSFAASNTPAATSTIWEVDGSNYYSYSTTLSTAFYTTGTHTVKLRNLFGTCPDTVVKQFSVKDIPVPNGFVTDFSTTCGAPATVSFRDTTPGAVKWDWDFTYNGYTPVITATQQAPSYTYSYENYYTAYLKVANADGCTATTTKQVRVSKPSILFNYTTDNHNDMEACGSLTVTLRATSDQVITSYLWNFGDGTTSTDSIPTHKYSKLGTYRTSLTYTTSRGCTGTVYPYYTFVVLQRPTSDFIAATGTTVCGNSIVRFDHVPPGPTTSDYWIIDGGWGNWGGGNSYYYQFQDTGKHTVMHITYNDGCNDTTTKVDYITVLSPFPKISETKNTCDGDRGTVTFKQTSRKADKWSWDFGDGTTTTLTTDEPVITHHYSRTGQYKVVLTAFKDGCSVKDSTTVYVMMKQQPTLASSRTTLCISDPFQYTLSNMERNPFTGYWVYYYVDEMQFGDGSKIKTGGYSSYNYWVDQVPFNGTLSNPGKGKDQIRLVLQETYFGCYDTSNYVPITVLGAVAGFEVLTDNRCFTAPVQLKDTSNAYNTRITSWQWNFGDGQVQTLTQGGTVAHSYTNPGSYYVTLKTTDSSGCTSTTSTYSQYVRVNGPKAAFSASGTNVPLNTTVSFYNNTNNYNSYNTTYSWDFGDGSTSTDYGPSHTFTRAGTYTVKLTAVNSTTGCQSEATQVILVKNFNSAFTFSTSYVTTSKCPPVLARFTNTSVNFTSVRWDFGDGFTAENVNYPSHVYDKPGNYIITLYVYGPNGLKGQYTDSLIVQQPSATLGADILKACTAQGITLKAESVSGKTLSWDFGDGLVQASADSVAVHYYNTPGVYNPRLIITDSLGCSSATRMSENIVIDSLSLRLTNVPATLCTPKQVTFQPTVSSVVPQQAYTYHWSFGTGVAADTSNVASPAFTYTTPGTYTVRLQVQSSYGCEKTVSSVINAFQGLGGAISGPAEVCQESTVQFYGTTQVAGQPRWQWTFHDGTTSAVQNPPPKRYDQPGTYAIRLLVDNNGCVDTIPYSLQVHAKPTGILATHQAIVCEGTPLTLTASGGATYAWRPSAGLNGSTGKSVVANPATSTTYTVVATSDKGCSNSDSVTLTVIHPFRLQVPATASVCSGGSIGLAASGAASYQWINTTAGLSNTAIANPTARPSASTVYTVTGVDAQGCFRDTASIAVTVNPLPTVDAGTDADVMTGGSYQLQPTASSDVVKWNWQPAKYLDCATCNAPLSTPKEPMTYTLTVQNGFGCTASDAVTLNLLCGESRIFIPNVFTPNRDGKNDKWSIRGQGIKEVKYLRIFDRWGTLVFERQHFLPGDLNAAWDGRYLGVPVPAGSYVYVTEMSCNENTFTKKGTVTVVF